MTKFSTKNHFIMPIYLYLLSTSSQLDKFYAGLKSSGKDLKLRFKLSRDVAQKLRFKRRGPKTVFQAFKTRVPKTTFQGGPMSFDMIVDL